MESSFQRISHALSLCHLLLHTGKDDDVGIHGHTDAKDDTRNTRKGQGHIKGIQYHQHDACIDQKRKAGCQTRKQVHKAHKNKYKGKSHGSGLHACADGLLAKLGSHHVGAQLLQPELKATDTDSGRQVLCLLVCKVTCNVGCSACDGFVDNRAADSLSIIDDSDLVAHIGLCCIGKLLGSFICQIQLHSVLRVSHIILSGSC